jgi:hypothetical protein
LSDCAYLPVLDFDTQHDEGGDLAKKKVVKRAVKMFRITYTQSDRDRVTRLQERFCNHSEVCLFRVLIDRVLCRYPIGSDPDRKFIKHCAKALDTVLSSEQPQSIQTSLDLGTLYEGYCVAMKDTFGFPSVGAMVRALLVLAEDEVI